MKIFEKKQNALNKKFDVEIVDYLRELMQRTYDSTIFIEIKLIIQEECRFVFYLLPLHWMPSLYSKNILVFFKYVYNRNKNKLCKFDIKQNIVFRISVFLIIFRKRLRHV